MVIDWDIWHPDFSPGKTSSLSGTQSQEINFAKTTQNLLNDFQAGQSLSDDCDATKKVAILVGVVSHLRAQSRTSDSIETQKQTNHLINLLLPVSPAPSRTEWWVKWLPTLHPTLRLHLGKASLSPFVSYFCLFVCGTCVSSVWMTLCPYLTRDEGGIASKWISWEADYLSMKHFVCGATGL